MPPARRTLFCFIFCLCLFASVFSVYRLTAILQKKSQTEELYRQLQTAHTAPTVLQEESDNAPEPEVHRPEESPLAAIYYRNTDLIGWLRIEDSSIDYPVVQRREDADFYLNHNFDGVGDAHGAIYADSVCDPEDWDNLIIYGHNMMDGTMFAQLSRYTDENFRNSHLHIQYSTLWETTTWRVVCVFKISADRTADFPYHTISKFDDMTANDYLARAQYFRLWSEDEPLEEGTRLLTLSTCEYTLDNGRLVIVAAEEK